MILYALNHMCLVCSQFFFFKALCYLKNPNRSFLVREHNFLADNLASINPHWSPDKVFEEARRILIAQVKRPVNYRLTMSLKG
jgi:hypothetical protein